MTSFTHPALICYDGSAEAEHAIDVAAELLRTTEAVVLDVTAPLTVGQSVVTGGGVPASAFAEANAAVARGVAAEGAEHAIRRGFDAKARSCVAPRAWQGIVEVADELEAPVVVIGSRSLSGLREFARSSVSHDVADHARRPVLIVPRGRAEAPEGAARGPALICYDGSIHARRGIEAAAALLRGRRAVVLEVAPLMGDLGYPDVGWYDPAFDEAAVGDALAGAEAGAQIARRAGFEAVARIGSAASVWRAVAQLADELDASVIVIGSRGLAGVREAVEGSLSHDVATHAGRPVLVVPPAA